MRKALVGNPFCPRAIDVHLLKSMLHADLQEIAGLEDLHLAIREAAHSLLRKVKPENS